MGQAYPKDYALNVHEPVDISCLPGKNDTHVCILLRFPGYTDHEQASLQQQQDGQEKERCQDWKQSHDEHTFVNDHQVFDYRFALLIVGNQKIGECKHLPVWPIQTKFFADLDCDNPAMFQSVE
jgi:hypothetical protein